MKSTKCKSRLGQRTVLSLFMTLQLGPRVNADQCNFWVRRNVAPDPNTTSLLAFDELRNCLIAFASENNEVLPWTWRWNGQTWDVVATAGPSARSDSGIVFDSSRGVIVLFGGHGNSADLNDTWEWDGTSWAQRTPTISPPPRSGHAMAFDAIRSVTVLFGGESNYHALTDTWEWNGVNWIQRSPQVAPNFCYQYGMAFDAARGVCVLFVGPAIPFNNGTWEWNGNNWTQRTSSHSPSLRHNFGMAYDQIRHRVVLFGGHVGNYPNGETWEWDGSDWLQQGATGPQPRERTSLVFDAALGKIFLLGGFLGSSTPQITVSDLWEWDGVSWSKASDGRPTRRVFHSLAYDSIRGRTVLFGGSRSGTPDLDDLGDTWEWDGSVWHDRSSSGPGPTALTAMAFDSSRGVTVSFSGSTPNGLSNQTWEWNGAVWTLASSGGPPPMYNHSLVYDSVRQTTVVFGGYTDTDTVSQTWEWNGNTWTERADSGPAARSNRGMSFDNLRGFSVLFGGTPNFNSYLGDTWEWNGAVWTQREPVSHPSERYRLASAFDSHRGVTVLFGGGQGTLYNNETWEWDEDSWVQRPASEIPALGGHAMTYDSIRDKVIVFGGLNNSGWTTNQIWELDRSGPPPKVTQNPNSPAVCQGSAVSLVANASGTGVLTYQWRKNGSSLSDTVTRFGTHSNILEFAPANVSDAGGYQCFINDDCGIATSNLAVLTVYPSGSADGNADGTTNARDIQPFIDALVNFAPVSAQLCAYDLTGEGIVNLDDLTPFVNRLLSQ